MSTLSLLLHSINPWLKAAHCTLLHMIQKASCTTFEVKKNLSRELVKKPEITKNEKKVKGVNVN